jgi:vacuolar iron transporter family protein
MIRSEPEEALVILRTKFESFKLPNEILDSITEHYSRASPEQLLSILLSFEVDTQGTVPQLRPWLSGITIAIAYFFGGFIPLLPYVFSSTIQTAFFFSAAITAIVLFTFGTVKGLMIGGQKGFKCLRGGLEQLTLGSLAAAAALICVKILDHYEAS